MPVWTAKAIVASTRTHKSTISRAVEALSRRGLIEAIRSPDDKREFRLRLTASGRRLFRQLEPLVLDYERKLQARLADGEGRALEKGITALERALKLEEGPR